MGIVELLDLPAGWETENSVTDRWSALKPVLLEYEEFMLAQLRAQRSPITHWAIYRFLIAVRTGDTLVADLVETSIPFELRRGQRL